MESWFKITLYCLIAIAFMYAIAATISLGRSKDLSPTRRFLQMAFAWAVPVMGPLLVMYLLAEHEPEAIASSWTGSKQVNALVFQALTFHAELANQAVIDVAEEELARRFVGASNSEAVEVASVDD